jgi:hydrogenase maturation protein HypF
LPVACPANGGQADHETVLGVGAHLKNSVALGFGGQAFVSQHVGDLETAEAFDAFKGVIADFTEIYRSRPGVVAHDLHPDYLSTKYAKGLGLPAVGVQHHYAHVASCMAENRLEGEVLGVSWDGTGYGADGTVWGGEFLSTTGEGFTRVAALRPFRLPGGEQAVREPRRSAVGILYEMFGDTFREHAGGAVHGTDHEPELFAKMIARGVNAPVTTSAGRLFDAVASIAGIRQVSTFEGQAAMELEFAAEAYASRRAEGADAADGGPGYGAAIIVPRNGTGFLTLDWAPIIGGILDDVRSGAAAGLVALKFHRALAAGIVGVAKRVGVKRVALTGGCFQNVLLLERAVKLLESEGFSAYWHQRVPPNDGGIALGQVYAAARMYATPVVGDSGRSTHTTITR